MSSRQTLPDRPLSDWLVSRANNAAADALEHFLLQFQSLNTRRSYRSDVDSFFRCWQKLNVDLGENLNSVSEKHVLLWLEQFAQSATRARKLASLSSFFGFCEQRKLLDVNPCTLIARPHVEPTQETQALNEQETLKLLNHLYAAAFDLSPTGVHARRQKLAAQLRFAVIHTLFSVGMRVDELCELRVADLFFEPPDYRLRFVSKGGDEHTTAVSESCAQVIKDYLNECRGEVCADDFVFVRVQATKTQVKLSQTAVFKMIRESARDAGLNKILSPHSARATVATVLHRQGVPLGFIQNLLNHKQITTTARYVKKANERDESAALKAPVSLWLGNNE
ncbi:MAG: hypothetical protein RLZZ488_2747 [Pseudomonadota bacterium]|jgi:integrase/recombinase XerD